MKSYDFLKLGFYYLLHVGSPSGNRLALKPLVEEYAEFADEPVELNEWREFAAPTRFVFILSAKRLSL